VSGLAGYVLRHRVRWGAGLLLLVAATSFTMALPWLFKRAVDALVAVRPWVAAIVAAAAVQAVLRAGSRLAILRVARDVEYELRTDAFAHLQRLPASFYRRAHTGDLLSRLVNDAGAVRLLLGPGLVNFVNAPLYLLWALAVMLTIDVRMTLLALAAYPLALAWVQRRSGRLVERSLRVQEGLAELSARVQENVAGMRVVKAYAGEAHAIAEFTRASRRFQRESLRLARLRGAFGPVLGALAGVGTLAVLWYGGRAVVAGRLSVGDLVAFTAYLQLLAVPTAAFGWMLSVLQRGRAAMRRLNGILAEAPAIASPRGVRPLARVRGELAFRDVVFRHGGGPPALADVSFTVPAGALVAIVGRAGAGKTSLLHLPPRLFDVDRGAVLLDGHDVRALPLAWLRRRVGLAPQEPVLFDGTIRDNVAFAIAARHGRRMDEAVALAGLAPDLAAFSDGLDAPVGERGMLLSGGQKQRVALARALAMEPEILLLDDPFASVDAVTERRMIDALRPFLRRRTTVLVANRVEAVRDADLIVVLEHGRVAETGTHAELLARGSVYPALFAEPVVAAAGHA
jgi:ATP-binding cassette subfamily B multidrug efflux pump